MTQFEKWFKAQFGKLPSDCRPINKIEIDIQDAKHKVAELEYELLLTQYTVERYRVAAYTRSAAEKKFEF